MWHVFLKWAKRVFSFILHPQSSLRWSCLIKTYLGNCDAISSRSKEVATLQVTDKCNVLSPVIDWKFRIKWETKVVNSGNWTKVKLIMPFLFLLAAWSYRFSLTWTAFSQSLYGHNAVWNQPNTDDFIASSLFQGVQWPCTCAEKGG